LIDERHFSDFIYALARRGVNIDSDSDHMLVIIKLRARICRASNTKPQQLRRFAVDRLKDRDVASRYYDELESELQGVQAQPLSLDEKCKKLEETIQRVATNTIGYTRKQAYKDWFDEECAEVNEEKNAARERAIQMLARWKEHFEEHLNKSSESEQSTRPVNLRDDGVDIDLPSLEDIEGLKYLKNNKAAGADFLAAELLKKGGPNLVHRPLHEVIQQVRHFSWNPSMDG
jgi:DNA anti-recombination protein RmuC